MLRSTVYRLKRYLHILSGIWEGWAIGSHEVPQPKNRGLWWRHLLIIINLLERLARCHGNRGPAAALMTAYAQLPVSVRATGKYFELICQEQRVIFTACCVEVTCPTVLKSRDFKSVKWFDRVEGATELAFVRQTPSVAVDLTCSNKSLIIHFKKYLNYL